MLTGTQPKQCSEDLALVQGSMAAADITTGPFITNVKTVEHIPAVHANS